MVEGVGEDEGGTAGNGLSGGEYGDFKRLCSILCEADALTEICKDGVNTLRGSLEGSS